MSNGVKIGLLIVIAGALGFLTYRLVKADNGDISSRPASENANGTATGEQGAAQKSPANTTGEASRNRAKTTMLFDKTEHDFGNLKQGDNAEYNFRFTNTGSEPLIIEDAKGSCGCTVPSYPRDPVAPGATGEIHVKFNSAGKEGVQKKTVTLTANTDPISTVLTIKAMVEVPKGSEKKPGSMTPTH